MRRNATTRRFTARALTNPKPSFVSLVKGGANQTPFKKVAADPAISGQTPEETNDMKIQRSVSAVAPKGYGILNLTFSKEKFADETAVKAWLDAGGYTEYEVVETSKSFEVNDTETSFESASTRKVVLGEDGITAFVAKLDGSASQDGEVTAKSDETGTDPVDEQPVADETTEEPAAEEPAAEPAANEEVVADASETLADGIAAATAPEAAADATTAETTEEAPAAPEVPAETDEVRPSDAAGVVIDEELAAKIDEVINALGGLKAKKVGAYDLSYMAEVLGCLRYLILDADYSGFDEGTVTNLKKAAKLALDAFVGAAATFATEYATATKSDPAVTQKSEEPDLAETIRAAVSSAIAPVQKAVTGLSSRVDEVSEQVTATKSALDERVSALETTGQTRKATTEPEVPTAEPKQRSETGSRILSAFGSRHSRG